MDGDRRAYQVRADHNPRAVHRLAALVRWREWFDSKLPMFLIAMFYAGLALPNVGIIELGRMGALLVLLCLYAAFGHLINDYSDRAIDLAAGKRRLLSTWSERECQVALTVPCVSAIVIAAFTLDGSTIGLAVGAFLTAALYSLSPVRLKERGLLGWAAAALAQRTLPVAMVFEAPGARVQYNTWSQGQLSGANTKYAERVKALEAIYRRLADIAGRQDVFPRVHAKHRVLLEQSWDILSVAPSSIRIHRSLLRRHYKLRHTSSGRVTRATREEAIVAATMLALGQNRASAHYALLIAAKAASLNNDIPLIVETINRLRDEGVVSAMSAHDAAANDCSTPLQA